ncbi:MAG: HEPN domain-containing protein [Leptospiraceae bacterium]|nr:HEPN domain-containing protein [Leptospiraceae bacterium]MCP5503430.1 HEPN domain-containing protein [Leptospiraceae bacterium]
MNLIEIKKHLLKAEAKLYAGKTNFQYSQYDDAVSRAYYSVYHAICSALLTKELSFSSHNQTLGSFNKEFINTGIFPKAFGKKIYKLFEIREEGDYDIDSDINKTLAEESIISAEEILNSIQAYITKIIS